MVYLGGKDIVHRDLAARNVLLQISELGVITGMTFVTTFVCFSSNVLDAFFHNEIWNTMILLLDCGR